MCLRVLRKAQSAKNVRLVCPRFKKAPFGKQKIVYIIHIYN